ncbi:2,3-dihydroxyphenylpropionate 1,2-dioxygenase [Sphaerisporangium krabiense]|uniref:2,3-dihydroxyphenylpropionate 1,2-dioxygenase n=1 Tax=Sphaerisporangium krabiense TaxID=763782 RepID=A0A7W9DN63_9ACTN|nr:catechol 1,2-dioxygenase [Sphaerisporangium krabiense]MBB5625042.1 2,3-dihydroxyphenylpropionate 1,2-dioxygenase [Sphaerisporangium krabiense]GII66920.1 2,3-dihydroxyphenylpropionate 1,2-dioxygenase [Sphaerisporangium krabiense]
MSDIVLGVGASHSTLMNTHWDQVVHTDRAEAFRDALDTARRRVAEARPDVAVIVGSNHFRGFWLDLIPAFTVGVGEVVATGEAGTPKGRQKTDPGFAQALAADLVEAGTEVAISARLQIDHGQSHAIQYLLDGLDVPVVPLVVNVFARPLPTLARCVRLGENLAAAVGRIAGERRVVVIASGGLSHRLPWPSDWTDPQGDDEAFLVDAWINGRGEWERYDERRREIIVAARPTISPEFDREFLDDLANGRLRRYASMTTAEVESAAGNGGQELRTWLVMAAALGFTPGTPLVYAPMPEWLTGMGVAVLDPAAVPASGDRR